MNTNNSENICNKNKIRNILANSSSEKIVVIYKENQKLSLKIKINHFYYQICIT